MALSQIHKSRSQSVGRGQTEPLAALVAVSLFCLAVSVYATVVMGVVPELHSDRELAEVTGERIWEAISEDGIYPADANLSTAIGPTDLPQGQHVTVNITFLGPQGYLVERGRAGFDDHGAVQSTMSLPDGETFSRPIPIQYQTGDIRPGTLTVVVSDEA